MRGILVPSIDHLIRMVDEDGRVVLNENGIWQQRADGTPLHFTDSIGRQSHHLCPPPFR
jgi:hypothetical protein